MCATMISRNAISSVVVSIILTCPVNSQAVTQVVYEQVSKAIVKVETEQASASGFLWRDKSHVVTALHVVDRCKNITVTYLDNAGTVVDSSSASVEKILTDSDLVLLKLKKPSQHAPLAVSPENVAPDQTFHAFGFPLNVRVASTTKVEVRFGGNKLKSILPPKVRASIKNYPSLDTEILNLEGNLVPGLSGAPIIDEKGMVVGIADGGLENGAVGICWAIPSAHLQNLEASKVKSLPNFDRVRELFAADLQADVGQTVKVGNLNLTKIRSRTFKQLAETADDKLGLIQLATIFQMFGPSNFKYDIYQELESGATIVVPEHADIIYGNGVYTINFDNQRMEMKFWISPVASPIDQQEVSVKFENELSNGESQLLAVDPQWSYMVPVNFNNITVRRKALYKNRFEDMIVKPEKYFFEAFATNGTVLISIAAINNNNSYEINQKEQMCIFDNALAGCHALLNDRSLWAKMVLAVQLTSFPMSTK